MRRRKHKRKMNRVVIVTSDAVDGGSRQYRIRPWFSRIVTLVLCVLIGVVIGYFVYEERIWGAAFAQNSEQSASLQALEEENASLKNEVQALNEQIRILSTTVNEKVQIETELSAQLEQQRIPSKLPLTGPASIEEVSEGEPMCIFTASAGSMVVAAAGGTVLSVSDDDEYGHNVRIDHGNGYITVYRNQGDATVKQGDSVVQGATLFVIGEDNNKLGYQMMKDNEFIDPMELLSISG